MILIISMSFLLPYISPIYGEGDYNHRLGDVNADGSIDIADVVYLFKNLLNFEKPIHYATKINVKYYDENEHEVNPYNGDAYNYKIVTDAIGQRYLLKNESEPIPEWADGKYDKVINVPLKNVVVMGSTEIALMEPLNDDGSVIDSVKGIMWGGGYTWYFEDIKEGLNSGKIIDVGSTYNPNWDEITALNPQLIFVYPGYDGDAIIEKM